VVLRDLATLMAMPSAGDLVIYGTGALEGNGSYIPELGAHVGPSRTRSTRLSWRPRA
jgi:hypothetical protein